MTSFLHDFTIVSRSGDSDQSNSSNFTFKNFPGGACPRTTLGGCASGARVRFRRSFRNSFDKGPMLQSDPGPTNSLCGPVCSFWYSRASSRENCKAKFSFKKIKIDEAIKVKAVHDSVLVQ